MQCLVTGAGGFIGSHLCEELVRHGHAVRALVHYNARQDAGNLRWADPQILREIEIVRGDIVDPYCVQQAVQGCAWVFHLAALIGIPYSYVAPESYVRTNVIGTLNVLQACRRCAADRLLHTSTSEVYGSAEYCPMDERHPLKGQSPYSATKIGADKLAESYHRSFGLPVVTVRPFNTYGPRQSARAVIPTIICQMLAGQRVIRLGAVDVRRDFTFVLDTATGFLALAAADEAVGEVVNLGQGVSISIADLFAIIRDAIGCEAEWQVDEQRLRPAHSEVGHLECDNTKAQALCGWSSQYSLEEGLRATIQFIRAHMDLYDPALYAI